MSDGNQWIEQRMAWLIEEFGTDRLKSADVILRNAEYFPDDYHGTEEDARLMFDRVCGYMEIDPSTVEMQICEKRAAADDEHGGVQGKAAGGYCVRIERSILDEPLGLVATMAHKLARIYLLGHRRVSVDEEDLEPLTDLLTVFLGMGIFTANSVLREQYWHAGAVSGWSMARSGTLSMEMYGYALALFAWARQEPSPDWAGGLRPDVRTAFHEGQEFLHVMQGSTFGPPGQYKQGRKVESIRSLERPALESVPTDTIDKLHDICGMCGAEDVETTRDDRGHMVCMECGESILENNLEIAKEQRDGDLVTRMQRRLFIVVGLLFAGTILLVGLCEWFKN